MIPLVRFKAIGPRFNANNKYISGYIFILFGILLYSLTPDLTLLTTLFTHPNSFLAFFIVVMALTVDVQSVKKLLKISKVVNSLIPTIVLVELSFLNLPVITNELFYFTLFEFLIQDKTSKIRKVYLLVLMVGIIIISNYYDNRALAIRFFGVLLLLSFFYLFKFLRHQSFKWLIVCATVCITAFVVTYFEEIFTNLAELVPNKTMDTTDTRTFIFTEFFSNFKNEDWIAGRGYLGTYFSTYFYHSHGQNDDHAVRFTAEVAIVDILLKGGLLILIPYLFLFIKAIYTGFIKAPYNSLSFKVSLLILVDFFLLSIENWPSFTVHYMFIWIFVGIIFNEQKTTLVTISLPYTSLNNSEDTEHDLIIH